MTSIKINFKYYKINYIKIYIPKTPTNKNILNILNSYIESSIVCIDLFHIFEKLSIVLLFYEILFKGNCIWDGISFLFFVFFHNSLIIKSYQRLLN